jgi:hypothetical protein
MLNCNDYFVRLTQEFNLSNPWNADQINVKKIEKSPPQIYQFTPKCTTHIMWGKKNMSQFGDGYPHPKVLLNLDNLLIPRTIAPS